MTARTPTDGRWSCSGCGFCCHLYQLGPVEPEVIDGLRARAVEADWAPAAAQPWAEQRPGPDGQPAWYLTHKDGACVFLRPDNLCAIHGLYGSDAKPGFCREFPYKVVPDPLGITVVPRPECEGYGKTFEQGDPVPQQVQTLLDLPRVVPRRPFAPEMVQALPDVRVPLATWMIWEQTLLADLDGTRADPASPEGTIGALRARLCALAYQPAPEPDGFRYVVAIRAAVEAVARMTEHVLRQPAPPSTSAWELAFVAEQHELLQRVRTRLAQDWSALDAPMAPDARRFAHLLLRGQILGKGVHGLGGVAEGLGGALLDLAIARVGQPEGDAEVTAAALGGIHGRWKKFASNAAIVHVLRLARPALQDAFWHAGG